MISAIWRSVEPPDIGTTDGAEPLGAVVRAQAAGEQAVAVGVVHHVAGPRAGGEQRARHQVRPGVEMSCAV